MGGEICKILPDLLLSAMEIIFKKYKNLKSKDISRFAESNHEDVSRILIGFIKNSFYIYDFLVIFPATEILARTVQGNHKLRCHCSISNARRYKHEIDTNRNSDALNSSFTLK